MIKQKSYRSKKYLKWVKTLPCANCQSPADDAHHLIGVGHMGGMGTKAPDNTAIPLCRGCHTMIHHTPTLWGMQWEWLARTLLEAVNEYDSGLPDSTNS